MRAPPRVPLPHDWTLALPLSGAVRLESGGLVELLAGRGVCGNLSACLSGAQPVKQEGLSHGPGLT